jgi:hypothetical protein
MADHYVGGFIHDWPEDLAKMRALVLYSKRYHNFRFPGGNSIRREEDGRLEVPKETLARAVAFKSGATVTEARLCHTEEEKNGHKRYFYRVLKVSLPAPCMLPKQTVKPGCGLSKADVLTCGWVPIEVFARGLYPGQLKALSEILWDMAMDPVTGGNFRKTFRDLIHDYIILP